MGGIDLTEGVGVPGDQGGREGGAILVCMDVLYKKRIYFQLKKNVRKPLFLNNYKFLNGTR